MTAPDDDFESRLTRPDLRAAHAYWLTRVGRGDVPYQHDIDPLDIQPLLPFVNMVDVVKARDGYRLRHALVGSELVDRFQSNHVGQWFEDLYTPEHLALQMPAYVEAIEGRRCTLGQVHLEDRGVDLIHYHRLIMPLADENGDIARLFLLFAFEDLADHTEHRGAGGPQPHAGRGSRAGEADAPPRNKGEET
jgi:hypothetical protein